MQRDLLMIKTKDFLKLRGSVQPVQNISDADFDRAVMAYVEEEYRGSSSSGKSDSQISIKATRNQLDKPIVI